MINTVSDAIFSELMRLEVSVLSQPTGAAIPKEVFI